MSTKWLLLSAFVAVYVAPFIILEVIGDIRYTSCGSPSGIAYIARFPARCVVGEYSTQKGLLAQTTVLGKIYAPLLLLSCVVVSPFHRMTAAEEQELKAKLDAGEPVLINP